jgi:phosphoenolpyruvate synthase/pyruvate phosphate dikinase
MSWLPYTRGAIHPYTFSIALRGHFELSVDLTGAPLAPVLYVNIGEKMYWYWGKEGISNAGQQLLKILGSPSRRGSRFGMYEKFSKKSLAFSEKIFKTDLKKISNHELASLLKKLYKESAPAQAVMNLDIDVIDVVFENFLWEKIKSEINGKIKSEQFDELYRKISIPAYNSFMSDERLEILKAALNKNPFSSAVERIHNKYWWTSLAWDSVRIHEREYFIKRLEKNSGKKDLKNKIYEITGRVGKIRADRKKVIGEYGFSKKIAYWLDVFDSYARYHDLRKEVQMKAVYAAHLILIETSRRTKVNADDLLWLWHDEIEKLLSGKKIDNSEISRRKAAISVLITEKSIVYESGKEALESHNKFLKKYFPKAGELKGSCASSGKAKGRARICLGSVDAMKKIKKGDILVTGMTTPDYVPAMRKAAAIITDEGGITCHAAIISRELRIPCIVGTKNATSILKDCDLVGVDAGKGIIKKLN